MTELDPSDVEASAGVVSIIMPVYNGQEYIAEAIASVVKQSYSDWELVVVDDGSTDGTAVLVAGAGDPRIRYIYQENRGQAAALNRGLDLCRGLYVTTLDADDALTPDSLRDRVRVLDARSDHDVVYADGYYCNSALAPLARFSQHLPTPPDGDVYPALAAGPIFGTGAAVMVRTDVLRVHELRYDETIVMCQDWDFYVRLAEHARFVYAPSISVYYRLHAGNMTATIQATHHLEATLRTRAKVLESPRFATVVGQWRREFWRRLLVNNLFGRPWDQDALLSLPQFAWLPTDERAALLRWMAGEYIVWGAHPEQVRRWLRLAWALAPGQPKTAFALLLAKISPSRARDVLLAWRRLRRRGAAPSPLELALRPQL